MTEITPAKQPQRSGRPWEKGVSGNPNGRPQGARNRATVAAEALLDGEAEKLTGVAINLALAGDITALRLCLDRIVPPRRDRPIRFAMPALRTVEDAKGAIGKIAGAVGSGELTAIEAGELSSVIDSFIKISDLAEIDRRLALLEARDR